MTGQERELIKNALKDWSQFKLKEQSISKEHPELIPILRKELNEIPEYESIGCLAKSIVFYADRRYVSRSYCRNAGFKFVKSTHVNYFWTHQRKRFSRNQCRMHILEILGDKYDSSLDVEENMSFAGWKKIYDCGFDVFEA